MAFNIDKIIFSPALDPISVTHTVGFGSSLSKTYTVQNIDLNEIKLSIRTPTGVLVEPSFVQLAPNQSTQVVITADRTFFDTLPKGANRFTVDFEFVGQGDPIDPTSDVIIYELQLTSTSSLTLKVGQTSTVTAQVLEKNLTKQTQNVAMNRVITFQSSNDAIVSVSSLNGLATGIAPGNAQITVASQGAGSQRVLVGVYTDPPAPRWWEKVVVNTTSGQRYYAGPFKTPIQPYPTRETRNGMLYDVYYVQIEEDDITTTTYYYDWTDVTDSISSLTDTEKLAKGYISSTTKPVAPAPQTVDGQIIRIITNAKFEERIVPVDVILPSVTPAASKIPGASVTPSPTPYVKPCLTISKETSRTYIDAATDYVCRDVQDPNGGCISKCGPETHDVIIPVSPSPTPSKIVAPKCYANSVWWDQSTGPQIYPPPTISYIDCNGNAAQQNVDFNTSQSYPQIICARMITSGYRVVYGTVVESPNCVAITPPSSPTPMITPSPTPLPPQTISFGVFGGRGTINGSGGPFSLTVPWGEAITVDCVAADGYAFDYATKNNILGADIGRIIYPNFLVYADGVVDEVRVYFVALPPPTSGTGGGGSGGGGLKT